MRWSLLSRTKEALLCIKETVILFIFYETLIRSCETRIYLSALADRVRGVENFDRCRKNHMRIRCTLSTRRAPSPISQSPLSASRRRGGAGPTCLLQVCGWLRYSSASARDIDP